MADPNPSVPVIAMRGVRKRFGEAVVTEVLRGIDLEVSAGELVAVTGASGSGKSTMLNLLGLLDRPSEGRVLVGGVDTATLDDAAITRLRGDAIGFVFQFHHLLPAFTAAENVMLPMILAAGRPRAGMRERAVSLLGRVGLGDRPDARPSELSGGQQQRVAIARALARGAPLVLADEPTGNLDSEAAEQVFALVRALNRDERIAFVVVTHDARLAARCDRVVTLVDGRIVADGPPAREGWGGR
jgi:lipoprotein-releasing system ATP-binding protein